jgi:hypothetical protein
MGMMTDPPGRRGWKNHVYDRMTKRIPRVNGTAHSIA